MKRARFKSRYGERLRELRHAAELPLEVVCARLGLSLTYLSDIERGLRSPLNQARTQELLAVLGCPERLAEILQLAGRSRRSIEIVLENQDDRFKDFMHNIACRCHGGEVFSPEVLDRLAAAVG